MRLLKDLKRFRRKLNRKPGFRAKFKYTRYYEKLSIQDNLILLEATNGNGINGNIFYIAKELNKPEYKNYNVFITVKDETEQSILSDLEAHELTGFHTVKLHSNDYCRILATAKYLFTDATFIPYFTKKDNQIYVNVWHGTPLKHMGKDINEAPYTFGNVLRNFLMADYLLYPNEFTKNVMLSSNNAENLFQNKIILGGYPRNAAFFEKGSDLKGKLDLNDYQIFSYLPTWRGSSIHYSSQKFMANFIVHLYELDELLEDNQIVFVNLHIFMSKDINLSEFKHIRPFPENIETYEFLNICDCLITDYSSVMFDYANTKKPVILYTFDEYDYLRDRGLYLDLEDLPFYKVETIEKLVSCLNNLPKTKYDEFLRTYCPFDSSNAARELIARVFHGVGNNNSTVMELEKPKKENILIYSGELLMNGITSSLFSMLENFDCERYNLFLTFQTSSIANNGAKLLDLPENVSYIPLSGSTNYTKFESIINYLFYKLNIVSNLFRKTLDSIYQREIVRCYWKTKFKTVIHFSGYNRRTINLFQRFTCKKIIFVHSNMVNEIKMRNNQHLLTLKSAYGQYDYVAVVTEGLINATKEICPIIKDIRVVRNTQNYEKTKMLSEKEIEFNYQTVSNFTYQELEVLMKAKSEKFVSIGRFSIEKDHAKLISAFEAYWKEQPNSYLIIIGGHGTMFDETMELVDNSIAKGYIILVSTIQNPYAIMKYCDLFLLSSNYEGLPMVFFEADALNIPVISTNIEGPKQFLLENGGIVVENSVEGLLGGMKKFHESGIAPMNINIDEYNKKSMDVLYDMIEN